MMIWEGERNIIDNAIFKLNDNVRELPLPSFQTLKATAIKRVSYWPKNRQKYYYYYYYHYKRIRSPEIGPHECILLISDKWEVILEMNLVYLIHFWVTTGYTYVPPKKMPQSKSLHKNWIKHITHSFFWFVVSLGLLCVRDVRVSLQRPFYTYWDGHLISVPKYT